MLYNARLYNTPLQHEPTITWYDSSLNEAGLCRTQKRRKRRNILRLTQSADGSNSDQLRWGIGRTSLPEQFGINHPGTYDVDPDTMRPVVLSIGLGEADNGMFRGTIG